MSSSGVDLCMAIRGRYPGMTRIVMTNAPTRAVSYTHLDVYKRQMLDLEDDVAENQKDVARFSLYHALKTVDYRGAERVGALKSERGGVNRNG